MRPNIIILEGTDGTGKSTLAKELLGPGVWSMHAAAPTRQHWAREYYDPITDHRLTNGQNAPLVLDRWHVGEYVWPTVFDRPSLFTGFRDFMTCHGLLVARGAVVYILTRDPSDILEELGKRGETEEQKDQAMEGYVSFAELGAMGLPNVVMCDLQTARTMLGLSVVRGTDSIRSIH